METLNLHFCHNHVIFVSSPFNAEINLSLKYVLCLINFKFFKNFKFLLTKSLINIHSEEKNVKKKINI
jgi:hypothetical protein